MVVYIRTHTHAYGCSVSDLTTHALHPIPTHNTPATGLVSIAGFGLPPGCRVPRPCTALIVHGTEDLVVPYDFSPQVGDKLIDL